jgi:predicted ATPase/transcriptional regulator with XRE-family HTH domain
MSPTQLTAQPAESPTDQPRWNEMLRALREARGITQDGWAAQIGVSRKTVQRWEAGERAPDPGAEAAILAYCRERNLFRAFTRGPLAGLELTPDILHDLLAEARFRAGGQQIAASGERTAPPQSPVLSPQPSNLPAALTSFVGREWELADVRRTLAGTRLLTLTGAGGCGKTRLALALAEELLWAYPHGVGFVELAALEDPALLPETVAAALGVQTVEHRPLVDALAEFLRSRHLLLILDNCEHLVPACAALAETLLRACPHLEIVATSRETLGVAGETVWRVPPLSLPSQTADAGASDAVRLFVERAGRYQPGFALTAANQPAIVRICERLDGIPLAIELAAACVKVLSVEQIADRLSDRFRLLTGGSRTALPRHQTLRATMDWSHDLLTPPEQAVLRRLSVFAGGWSLEAAEAVCTVSDTDGGAGESDTWTLHHLTSLVDKSLVVAEQHGRTMRYRLLETVRQYAGERLDEAGETAAVRGRHLAWYLALAEAASAAFQGPNETMWLNRLEEEHDNLRTALTWSLTSDESGAALRLAAVLPRFWEFRGHISEGRQWLTRALAARKCVPAGVRAAALHAAGWLAYKQGDYAVSRPLLERGLRLQQKIGNRHGIAASQDSLACLALRSGEHAAARTLIERSLASYTELGSKRGTASVLDTLGMLALREDQHDVAHARFTASLALFRDLGDKAGIAETLCDLATVAVEAIDQEHRVALLEESLALYREIGHQQGIALVLGNLGMARWVRGDRREALALLEESLALHRAVGDRRGVARLLGNQALVALYQREYERAATLGSECLALHRELRDPWTIARYLPVLAGVALGLGDPARAACLYAAAAGLRERLGGSLPPAFRDSHDRAVAAARAALGEEGFAQAWTAGWSMPWEEAVAFALREAERA